MRLPWSRRRGNRHAWEMEICDLTGIFWQCRQCGAITQECDDCFNGQPAYGCTALPIPATGAAHGDGLPVVGG